MKINKHFLVNIELLDIYANPTAKELASFLSNDTKEKESDFLITIKKEGDKSPIIFIHPVGGAIFCYLPLIRYLENLSHPIYCIQDPFITENNIEFKNIHEVASCYISKIEHLYKNYPYILIGSSYGGVVAWEMTKQLLDRQKTVSNLILLDSWAKNSESHIDFKSFAKAMQRHQKALEMHLENSKENLEIKKPWLELQWQRMEMLLKHTPSVIHSTNVVSFKAKEILEEYLYIDEPTNHWNKYHNNTITTYLINGDHESILTEPNVRQIIEKIIYLLS